MFFNKSFFELSKFWKQKNKETEKVIGYITCTNDTCNQKFQPFYFSDTKEPSVLNSCPTCTMIVEFANPEKNIPKKKFQKIIFFKYDNLDQVKKFGIILLEERKDTTTIIKDKNERLNVVLGILPE